MTFLDRLFISDNEKSLLKAKAKMDYEIFKDYLNYITIHYQNYKPRILELGCGNYKQIPILFLSHGYNATGIDNFSHSAQSSLFQNYQKEKYYYKQLSYAAKLKIKTKADIVDGDAINMKFDDSEFDVVFSNAVFEHLSDVPKATAELHRVMKKGARAKIGIHLFPSLSGSHHPAFQENPLKTVPDGIQPWYHLRQLPGDVASYLNQYREQQYRECFQGLFKIENEISPNFEEGKEFLTQAILEELKDFTKEELLKRWIIFELIKL